jgi:type I restriction enzyme S subunit
LNSNWIIITIGEAVDFNPKETIKKGTIAKKIAMGQLTEFERKIKGYELEEYKGGPKFRNKDTLVARITPSLENGKTAQVNLLENNEVAFGSTEFIVLRANNNTIDDFVFYLAKSPTFREKAISCMEGTSGRRRVNENVLKSQLIKLPDLNTQQKIASVLSSLDAKIELNNKINQELETMAKTLYDYWFVQFDFPNSNGKPYKSSGGKMVYNKELKREIPEGWEVKKISHLLDVTTGKEDANFAVKNGKYPFFYMC